MKGMTIAAHDAKVMVTRVIMLAVLTGVYASGAHADACRAGSRGAGALLGTVVGGVADVGTVGLSGGQATMVGGSVGAAVGFGVGEAVCPERVDERMIEERSLGKVMRMCLKTLYAYSSVMWPADSNDICTVPVNPYIRGEDVMGLGVTGRQLDVIDVIRQVRATFQAVGKRDKRAEMRNLALDFADDLGQCVESYKGRLGFSLKSARDRCYVKPTKLTHALWGGSKIGRGKHVAAKEVLRAIVRAIPEGA